MKQQPWHHRPKRILALVLAVVILIVAWQNRESVETRFLMASVRMPRAALILLSLVVGYVLGVVDTKFRRGVTKARGLEAKAAAAETPVDDSTPRDSEPQAPSDAEESFDGQPVQPGS